MEKNLNEGQYIACQYRAWLLKSVLIECWTVRKCAEFLDKPVEQVQRDFDKFINEK